MLDMRVLLRQYISVLKYMCTHSLLHHTAQVPHCHGLMQSHGLQHATLPLDKEQQKPEEERRRTQRLQSKCSWSDCGDQSLGGSL